MSSSSKLPVRARSGDRSRWVLLIGVASLLGFALVVAYARWHGVDWQGRPIERAGTVEGFGKSILIRQWDGRRQLWGGGDESQHFDITSFDLDSELLEQGLGREYFSALLEPTFVPLEALRHSLRDEARLLVAEQHDQVKIYPLYLLSRYEVINDTLGDRPVMVAYCFLADLAAVYERRIGDHTFTFAVSGYTYRDPEVWEGRPAFVLWDRDTESLWWPPIGKAVSGQMAGSSMRLLDQENWAQTTWGEIKDKYPEALILANGQHHEVPGAWPRFNPSGPIDLPADQAIAPYWGDNTTLDNSGRAR